MSKQLPTQPNLEQLKNQAKDLRKAHQQADPEAIQRIKDHHPRLSGASDSAIFRADFSLQDAQLVLAREYGFPSWSKLVAAVTSSKPHSALPEDVDPPRPPAEVPMTADEMEAALDYLGLRMERFSCEVADHHDIQVSLQQSVKGNRKKAQDLATLTLDPGQHTLLLFMHQNDDEIDFAIQSEGYRSGGGKISTNECNARVWDRLTPDPLPVGKKLPIFVWAANHQTISSLGLTKSVDDLVLEYEMAIVISAEIQQKQD